MNELIQTLVQTYDVTYASLWMAVAVGMAGGVAGVFVVLRRESLLALVLPQTSAVGAAVALRYGLPVIPVAMSATALAMGVVAVARWKRFEERVLPALYVGCMGLALLIISGTAEHAHDIHNVLHGGDVYVTDAQLQWAIPTLLLVAGLIVVFWRRWVLIAQLPEAAQLAGAHPLKWHATFLVMLASLVIVGTSTCGMIMVLSALFLPAATVLPWAKRLPGAMTSATLMSVVFVIGGYVLAVVQDWPFSHTVATLGLACATASQLIRGALVLWRRQ